jgi:hypothetical protein
MILPQVSREEWLNFDLSSGGRGVDKIERVEGWRWVEMGNRKYDLPDRVREVSAFKLR